MGKNSAIEWTHHTFNPWWGCTKVSAGCDNCYAERGSNRFGKLWGAGAPRRFFGAEHWAKPLGWARRAEGRERVFCASYADVFERLPYGHPDAHAMNLARQMLWSLIEDTPELDWLLLTKRPENIRELIPSAWCERGAPQNTWWGVTVEDDSQRWRFDTLCTVVVPLQPSCMFISYEPAVGPLHLRETWLGYDEVPVNGPLGVEYHVAQVTYPRLDWVICGGESGPGARPMELDWARRVRDDCERAQVAFFLKQLGGARDKRGGDTAVLDGQVHKEFPAPLQRDCK